MTEAEFSTIPEYALVKTTYANLYFMALNCMGDYIHNENFYSHEQARKSIYSLALALKPKLYILQDPEANNYIHYFITNPDKFKFLDLHTTFLILQTCVERLGITKIETLQLPKYKSFTENANY